MTAKNSGRVSLNEKNDIGVISGKGKEMDEKKMRQAVAEWQTPFYLFDTDVLTERVKKIRSVVGGRAEICYAMKANPFLTGVLRDTVEYF